MKRIIKTYETCSDELLGQLAEKYPNGIKQRHLQQFTTHKGERIKVVELATEDTIYLIKFSTALEDAIDNFEIEDTLEIEIEESPELDIPDASDIDEE